MKRHIPNFITLLNLFCGCLAIVATLYGHFALVPILYIVGVAFDYADGFVARILGVSSPLGKELDSLADMVSFGFLPGAIYFMLLQDGDLFARLVADNAVEGEHFFLHSIALGFVGFLITLFACLRLAKFNIDTRQSEDFIGLATPSATAFAVGLLYISEANTLGLGELVTHPIFLIVSIIIFSYLMVSEFRMFGGKFKHFKWAGNEIKYIFAVLAILELIFFGWAALSFIILTYILMAFIYNLVSKKHQD